MKKVLKFYADWCQPCKMLSKTLESIETNISIEEINIDENPELAIKYSVRGVPTMIMLENEEVKKQIFGTKSKQELEKWLND